MSNGSAGGNPIIAGSPHGSGGGGGGVVVGSSDSGMSNASSNQVTANIPGFIGTPSAITNDPHKLLMQQQALILQLHLIQAQAGNIPRKLLLPAPPALAEQRRKYGVRFLLLPTLISRVDDHFNGRGSDMQQF